MIIGIPKEIKNNENRVSMTPAGVFALCKAGHQVYVEQWQELAVVLMTMNIKKPEQ